MIETMTISDYFDVGDDIVVTLNATRKQRQAIANGAPVSLVTASGELLFDRIKTYGTIDRSEFLSDPDLRNIGLSFERLTNTRQIPVGAAIRVDTGNKDTYDSSVVEGD